MSHGENIYHPKLFEQLKTYTGTPSKDGKQVNFAVDNYKHRRDDVIDATFYAFICRMAFQHFIPTPVDDDGHDGVSRRYVRTKLYFDTKTKKHIRVADVKRKAPPKPVPVTQ